MPTSEHSDRLASPATLRAVVTTGVKLAYAAPIVASSLKLREAAAQDCSAGQDSCNGADYPCGETPGCYCTNDTEGNIFCAQFTGGTCHTYQTRTSSSGCPSGQRCAPGPDCCGGICVAPCAGFSGPGAGAEFAAGAPPIA